MIKFDCTNRVQPIAAFASAEQFSVAIECFNSVFRSAFLLAKQLPSKNFLPSNFLPSNFLVRLTDGFLCGNDRLHLIGRRKQTDDQLPIA